MAKSPTDTTDGSPPEALEEATVYTVAELNDDIATVLDTAEDIFFDYIVGEVTDARDVNSHLHFDLDHDDASIHCVVFGFRRSNLTDDLDDGSQVAVVGDLSYYEAQGSCSILVTDVVELGTGTYRQTYRENKEMLEEEGLLADKHKQDLTEYPRTIGIVTSANSDAREDAVTSIHEQHPDVDIVVQHASVQGDDALPTLLEATSTLDRDPDVDVIVLTRGGGADRTLRVFNDPSLCRVVFETETPIVVGVGHEQDRTLAEEVADQRVMTPTHVGSIVPEKATLVDDHQTQAERLEDAYHRTVTSRLETTANRLETSFVDHATGVIDDRASALDHALETHARERLTDLSNRLDHGVESIEQQVEHKREKAAATQEIEETYTRRQRVQRVVIVVLLLLLLGLTTYMLLVM